MTEDDRWAPLVGRFVDAHYQSLHGRVRNYVIGQHLDAHLPPPPDRIVDVGGGGGNQSIPLARRGYDVTILDQSAAMLERAVEAVAKEDAATAGRIRLVTGRGEEVVARLGGGRFGGVLCHGVLMYVDDPRELTAALCAAARPGGIVSIVAKNRAAMAVRPAVEGRWADALAAFDARREVNRLGLDTRADSVEELSGLLAEHAVDPVAWYGVRLFTDNRADDAAPPDDEEACLAVELEATRRDPYRRLSRLFHLVGRKRS